MNQIKSQKLLNLVFFLSILGIAVSGYLVYLHYSALNSPCDFSETFQCSLVSRSQYAQIFNIPVAMFGLLGYLFLGTISLSLMKWKFHKFVINHNIIKKVISTKSLLFFSVIALVFSLYLTYAEFFLIKALCIFCLISQAIILTIATISYQNNKLSSKKEEI